jgi:GcrA cell cycle regulator
MTARLAQRHWSQIWTPEMDAELRLGVHRMQTYTEIAKQLGVSKNAVIGRAHRLHIRILAPRRKLPRPVQEFPPPGCCLYSSSKTGPFIFCGKPAIPNKAWCEEHAPLLTYAAPP